MLHQAGDRAITLTPALPPRAPRPDRYEPASEWRVARVKDLGETLQLTVVPRTMRDLLHD